MGYGKGPLIAATPQPEGRTGIKAGCEIYDIGGFHPYNTALRPPAFDIRHGRTILTILVHRDLFSKERFIRFSMKEFCTTYANYRGGRYTRDILAILQSLTDIYVRVGEEITGEIYTYRVLDEVCITDRPVRRRDDRRIHSGQTELWLNGCLLSAEFFEILNRPSELLDLRLDQLKKITHPLGQAAYFYLPSRAHHHGAEKPWPISVKKLCEQVAYPVPKLLCHRLKLFTFSRYDGPCLLEQMDGRETASGIFRVRLEKGTPKKSAAEEEDYILHCWSEKRVPLPEDISKIGELKRAFLASGGGEVEWNRRIKRDLQFLPYQIHWMDQAQIDTSRSLDCLCQAHCILGTSVFDSVLSEVKGYIIERRQVQGKTVQNPTGFLISACIRAIKGLNHTAASTARTSQVQRPGPAQRPAQVEKTAAVENDDRDAIETFWTQMPPEKREQIEHQLRESLSSFQQDLVREKTPGGEATWNSLRANYARESLGLKPPFGST